MLNIPNNIMWHQNHHLVPQEVEPDNQNNNNNNNNDGGDDDLFRPLPQRRITLGNSSSQVSLGFINNQGSRSIGRSHSLGSVKHCQQSSSQAAAASSASGGGSGAHGLRRGRASQGIMSSNNAASGVVGSNGNTMMNETFRLGSFFTPQVGGGGGGGINANPFLDNNKVNLELISVAAAASGGAGTPLLTNLQRQQQQQQQQQSQIQAPPSHLSSLSRSSSATGLLTHRMSGIALTTSQQQQHQQQKHRLSAVASILSSSESSSVSADEATTTHEQQQGAPSPTPDVISTGPSELYRLIVAVSSPQHQQHQQQQQQIDWEIILSRALSHPHEACFYDPNAGGHVYALHRLLRCTGGDDDDDDDDDEGGGYCGGRPPVSVVEAVMRACPRAVTRKQAVIDEEDLMSSSGSEMGGVSSFSSNNNMNMEWQVQQQQQQQAPMNMQNNLLLNLPPPAVNVMQQVQQQQDRPGNDVAAAAAAAPQPADNDAAQEEDDEQPPNEDVRFEYPLAIACECEQDGEIVRLLASYLAKTKPVYRSEVFRSLDYASLPNPVVRILLEEYAGCVLERGMNSEATEGDDDDCPLEQVLFWWDDPDMMGMEEDIANYPHCNMKEDLCDLWEKLRMMLYAATMGTMGGYDHSKESFQVLHHVLRIVSDGGIQDVRFPSDFAHAVLLLAKFIQREKVSMFEERDETGSLPLHIAVSGDRLLRRDDSRVGRDEEIRNGEDGNGQGENNQNDNVNNGEGMDGVVQAGGGPVEGEANQQNNRPLPQEEPQERPRAGYVPAPDVPEAVEDDEEENAGEGDDDNEDLEEMSTMRSDMEIIRLLLDQHPASIRLRDSQSGSLPVHLALQHNPLATEAIEHFLELYPRSVTMPDGDGRLPIHTALLKKSPAWNKVLSLSPIALETRDPITQLLPFQLAAMSKQESEETATDEQESEQEEIESLSTCFRLLRMSPCLASGLGNIKQRPQSLIEQNIMLRYKPRVAKLEEENERLRRRVEELELKFLQMKMQTDVTGSPSLKKRKSSFVSSVSSSFLA